MHNADAWMDTVRTQRGAATRSAVDRARVGGE